MGHLITPRSVKVVTAVYNMYPCVILNSLQIAEKKKQKQELKYGEFTFLLHVRMEVQAQN